MDTSFMLSDTAAGCDWQCRNARSLVRNVCFGRAVLVLSLSMCTFVKIRTVFWLGLCAFRWIESFHARLSTVFIDGHCCIVSLLVQIVDLYSGSHYCHILIVTVYCNLLYYLDCSSFASTLTDYATFLLFLSEKSLLALNTSKVFDKPGRQDAGYLNPTDHTCTMYRF